MVLLISVVRVLVKELEEMILLKITQTKKK